MHIHDICVIGAGPNAIAQIARLREATPSALFSDQEHFRFHFLKKWAGQPKTDRKRGLNLKPKPKYDLLVLDRADTYMAGWHKAFEALQITHLRSPMFFHVDPSYVDALVSFAEASGRQSELREITNVVGKEHSKHKIKSSRRQRRTKDPAINERNRQDYFTPSTALFQSFCDSLIQRYDMPPVTKGCVVDVIPVNVHGLACFEIKTADGAIYYARYVISAVGHANSPCIPCSLEGCEEGACHSSQIAQSGSVVCPHIQEKIARGVKTSTLVCGGGLTSAQIVDVAIRSGIEKIYLLCRSNLKVKPFDVSLEWVGKFSNEMKSRFWMEDSAEERLKIIAEGRNGGSITPIYHAILKQHMQAGRLEILTHSELSEQVWDPLLQQWTVAINNNSSERVLTSIDYIYFATGARWEGDKVPFLRTLRQEHPISTTTGFPALTEDLQWCPDVNCFLIGGFAALQVGPGAFNLEGARACAERVALQIEALERGRQASDWKAEVLNGTGSYFAALEVDVAE